MNYIILYCIFHLVIAIINCMWWKHHQKNLTSEEVMECHQKLGIKPHVLFIMFILLAPIGLCVHISIWLSFKN